MASIRDYHRPWGIDEALALLNRAGTSSVLLGGGTTVVPGVRREPVEVIDLQAVPLDGVTIDADRVRIGAMTRLRDVIEAEAVPALIRDAAKREAPETIRNAATMGGAIAGADWESGLLAALLVHHARVELVGEAGTVTSTLADLLADPSQLSGRIIVSVSVATGGETSWAGTGRTPADTPIVAAYARRQGTATTLAITGVAPTPRLVDPDAVAGLDPPSDFRGSTEYRRSLARTLTSRVLEVLEAQT